MPTKAEWVPRAEYEALLDVCAGALGELMARVTHLEAWLKIRRDSRQDSDAIQFPGPFNRLTFGTTVTQCRERFIMTVRAAGAPAEEHEPNGGGG